MIITAEYLRSRLDYNQATGVFVWRTGRLKGSIAGHVNFRGYRLMQIGHHRHYAHRLAWLYVHGAFPDAEELDHANGQRDDNRIQNLRPASRSQNRANSGPQKRNPTGLKGVTYIPRTGRWRAQIYNGRQHYLGHFATAEEAHAAYVTAAKRIFGEFAYIQREARPLMRVAEQLAEDEMERA